MGSEAGKPGSKAINYYTLFTINNILIYYKYLHIALVCMCSVFQRFNGHPADRNPALMDIENKIFKLQECLLRSHHSPER